MGNRNFRVNRQPRNSKHLLSTNVSALLPQVCLGLLSRAVLSRRPSTPTRLRGVSVFFVQCIGGSYTF